MHLHRGPSQTWARAEERWIRTGKPWVQMPGSQRKALGDPGAARDGAILQAAQEGRAPVARTFPWGSYRRCGWGSLGLHLGGGGFVAEA